MAKLQHKQDYPVAPEQEAQNIKTRSIAYKCYQAFLHELPNRYKLLDKVKRHGVIVEDELTEKTVLLSEKAKKILRVVLKTIFRGGKAVVKQKYLYKITKCCEKQNKRLLNELLDFIQYKKIPVWEGRKISYYFSITLSAELQDEIKDVELENTNLGWTKMSDPICNNRDSNKLEYRSNAQAHESKFLNDSISNCSDENAETPEPKKPTSEVVEVKISASKKNFLGNKRKTVTNAERVTRYQKFKAYDKPKSLAEHYPLSQENCYELQKRSGKGYNLNAMNEILLDMSRKTELQEHSFVSKAKFMTYMTKAYREEERDVDRANSPNFKIMVRRPKAEVAEIATQADRERYFEYIEINAMRNPGGIEQFKARVVQLAPNQAYNFVINLKSVKKVDNVLKVCLVKRFDFTQYFLDNVLDKAKGIGEYIGVEELEFVV